MPPLCQGRNALVEYGNRVGSRILDNGAELVMKPLGHPEAPSIETSNPRLYASDTVRVKIGSTMHPPTEQQLASLRDLSNDALIMFRPEDPISSADLGECGRPTSRRRRRRCLQPIHLRAEAAEYAADVG